MKVVSDTYEAIERFRGFYGHLPSCVFVGVKQADEIREHLKQFGVVCQDWQRSDDMLCGLRMYKVSAADMVKVAE